ncbi:MAG: SurA N-terminal domain-containing protein [Neomegalonema sp.]|nr:SurA N-terminal domain-containing protein [Neomegalonema sp.]
MIELFQKYSRSWVAKIVIGLFAGAMVVTVFQQVQGGYSGLGGASSVATVGGKEISAVDYVRAVRQRALEVGAQDRRVALFEQARGQILRELAQIWALAAEARAIGVDAPDSAVREALRGNPAFRTEGGAFDVRRYEFALARLNVTKKDFEASLRRELSADMLIGALDASLDAPKAMTELGWRRQGEERDLVYVKLPISAIAEPAAPDDAKLKAYYDAKPERFRVPERRKVRIMMLLPEHVADVSKVPETDIRAKYDAEIAKYKKDEKRNLQQLLFKDKAAAEAAMARIKDGATFATIAAELKAKRTDTDLGYVTAASVGKFQPELAKAAFDPAVKDQSVVGPTPVKGGKWSVVYIAGIQLGFEKKYEDVKADIAKGLAIEKAKDGMSQRLADATDLRAQGVSLAEIAKQLRGKIVERVIDASGLDETGAPAKGLPEDPRLPSEAFKMKVGDERDIKEIAKTGGFYDMVVLEITKSYLPPLKDAKAKVISSWQATERRRLLGERAESIRKRLAAGEDAKTVATEFALELKEAKGLKRGAAFPDLPAALIASAFETTPAKAVGHTVLAEAAGGSSRVIGRVAAVRELDPKADATAYKKVADAAKQQLARDILLLYAYDVTRRQVTSIDRAASIVAMQRAGILPVTAAPTGR